MTQIPITEKYCAAYSQLEALLEHDRFSALRTCNLILVEKQDGNKIEFLRQKWQNSYLKKRPFVKELTSLFFLCSN